MTMMIRNILIAACLAFMASNTVSAAKCLTEAPKTVYEAEELSPQNMDYDDANNLFPAHPGWINNKEIHYFKFLISAGEGISSVTDVPINKLYLVTTTGDYDGVIGKPIIEFHHADASNYSDFMEISFVLAPQGVEHDSLKSVDDIALSAAIVTPTGTLVNLPVVPTGSYLQHPETKGTNRAPIDPIVVWYKCVEVWTYAFEVTSEDAATFFSSSRLAEDVATGRSAGSGYEASVAPSMGTPSAMSAIPIWHINQFQRGVVNGTDGGPDPNGMRNVINLDRPDAGYSPLWQIFWATSLPIDYSANEASSKTVMTAANGFEFFAAPMFVNCPNIGPVGTAMNPEKMSNFSTLIRTSQATAWILGSHESLIFNPDMPITLFGQDGTLIGSTMTNMMGAYEYELDVSLIPANSTIVKVMFKEALLRTIPVLHDGLTPTSSPSTSPSSSPSTSSSEDSEDASSGVSIMISFNAVFAILGFFVPLVMQAALCL